MKATEPEVSDRLSQLGLSKQAIGDLLPSVNFMSLKQGDIVFHGGDPCKHFVLPLSGSLHVNLTTASGRQMLLYTVAPGELCVQTFQCLATGALYSAEGHVMEDMDALVLTASKFRTLMAESQAFRDFLLRIVANRFSSLTGLIEDVASVSVSARLARYLLSHSHDDILSATQDAIAVEVSASREAVSRILNLWKQQRIIDLSRGTVKVINKSALFHMAP